MLNYNYVLGIKLVSSTYQNLLKKIILAAMDRNTSKYICFVNAHMAVKTKLNTDFASVLKNADFATLDGVSILKANRLLHNDHESERFSGMDSIYDILREAESNNLKVLFYGSTNDVLDKIATKICCLLPKLQLVGTISPPFRKLSGAEMDSVANEINNRNPHLIFVSLGCPKQEYWMFEMKGKVNGLMLGVGNAFLTFAGLEKRAPIWMQNVGLEWLYRLLNEPKRLWKRYLITNSLFIYFFILEYMKKRLRINRNLF